MIITFSITFSWAKNLRIGAYFSILLSFNTLATTLRFSVGPDHQEMMDNNYSVYRANWEFLTQSLALLDVELVAKPMPWARAKSLVQAGTNHGLFLAANFEKIIVIVKRTNIILLQYSLYFLTLKIIGNNNALPRQK